MYANKILQPDNPSVQNVRNWNGFARKFAFPSQRANALAVTVKPDRISELRYCYTMKGYSVLYIEPLVRFRSASGCWCRNGPGQPIFVSFCFEAPVLQHSMAAQQEVKAPILSISADERKVLMEVYDTDKNELLSDAELAAIVKDYNDKKVTSEKALTVLKRFDVDGNGVIDGTEVLQFKHRVDMNETNARYAAYSASFARAFRYLAFTSDFGEALRPVVSKAIVNSSYAVAIGYCFADVGWEAYKLKKRNYLTEKGEPMSMTQCIVERSTFQAVASIAVPTLVVHTAVDIAKKVTTRVGRYTKWGPSIVGLSIIPLLPMYIDHPVGKYGCTRLILCGVSLIYVFVVFSEHALEWTFANYGPWANKKSHKD
jgi:fission process protein 1